MLPVTTVVSSALYQKLFRNSFSLIIGGTIAIDPEPNYGETPVISKEYAKLRKEFHQLKQTSTTTTVTQSPNAPFYVIAENPGGFTQKIHRHPTNFGTTRHFNGLASNPSTKKPYFPSVYYATTHNKETIQKPQEDTTVSIKGYENRRIPDYEDMSDTSILKLMNSLLESHLGNDDGSPTEGSWGLDLLSSLLKDAETTTVSSIEQTESTTVTSETEDFRSDSTVSTLETEPETTYSTVQDTTTETLKQVTFKNVLNTTDCTENEISDVEHRHSDVSTDANTLQEVTDTSTEEQSDNITSTEHDITEVDLEYKVDVAKPLPTIELLQNLTKMKEEGLDYDYNDLPPSLPNLR